MIVTCTFAFEDVIGDLRERPNTCIIIFKFVDYKTALCILKKMESWIRKFTPLIFALMFALLATSANAVNPDAGKKIFNKCKSCHTIGKGAKPKVGPPLNDILGMAAAAQEGYVYSNAMKAKAEEGLVWTEETLSAFLADPKNAVPKTKMVFSGLKKEYDRANVIAYLKEFAQTPVEAANTGDDPPVSAEILAIEGDVEYGEYLSSSCLTCHQADGSDQGLPSIVGWPKNSFVTVMQAYKVKHRENPVMQQYAGALSNEEIAALAAYFGSVE